MLLVGSELPSGICSVLSANSIVLNHGRCLDGITALPPGGDNDVYDTWRETGEAGVSANGSLRSGAPCSGAFLANKGSREREEGREDAYRETRAIINVWFTSVESK